MTMAGVIGRQLLTAVAVTALAACAERTHPTDRAVTECRAAYAPGSPEFRICYRGVLAYYEQARR